MNAAEDRAWEVVKRAYLEREPRRRSTARTRLLLALAVVAAGAVIAAALSPPGHAVFERMRRAVGVEHAAPAIFSLPGGGRLLVVSADREQAVIGGVVNGDAWGVFTDDPAVVLVAVEYVRHDIAMHLIAEKFDLEDFEQFWTSDPALRRLRADHGAPAALLRRSAGSAQNSSSPRRSRRRPST